MLKSSCEGIAFPSDSEEAIPENLHSLGRDDPLRDHPHSQWFRRSCRGQDLYFQGDRNGTGKDWPRIRADEWPRP